MRLKTSLRFLRGRSFPPTELSPGPDSCSANQKNTDQGLNTLCPFTVYPWNYWSYWSASLVAPAAEETLSVAGPGRGTITRIIPFKDRCYNYSFVGQRWVMQTPVPTMRGMFAGEESDEKEKV